MPLVSFNPIATTNVSQSFLLQTDGEVSGFVRDDPGLRWQIEGAQIAQTQATPIWGGLPLSVLVAAPGPGGSSSGLGPIVQVATAQSNINAWAVFNQSAGMIILPGSGCPQALAGMSINIVRTGTRLILNLPLNPAVVNTISGGASNQGIYWNFANNYVDIMANAPGGTTPLGLQIIDINTNSKAVTYNPTTGVVNYAPGSPVIGVEV